MNRYVIARSAAAVLSLLLCVCAQPAFADAGKVLESREFKSAILGRNVRYSVYLPPGYESNPTRHYASVYLLHGYPTQPVNSETDWIQQGSADRLIDEAIASGRLPPLIVIMPDAKATWYMNSFDGKVRYEDMLVQEFVPFIDKTFRTREQRLFRSTVGLSMGGYGAMMLALRHPDLFAAAAALSPGIRTEEEMAKTSDADYAQYWAPLFGPAQGEARITDIWRSHSPLSLMQTLPVDDLKKGRWWIDIGDDDFLSQGSDALHTVMKQRGIPHEYRVRDGGHTWLYWRTGLIDALEFVAGAYR